MNARQAGELVCRVLAVYVWVRGLQVAASIFRQPTVEGVGIAVFFVLVFALAGWLVLRAWAFAPGDPDPDSDQGRTDALVRTAYSVLGLWFVVENLPRLASDSMWWMRGEDLIFGWQQVVGDSIAVAVGLALFFQVPGMGWAYRRTLAPGQGREGNALPAVGPDRFQTVAFSILGFYFMVLGGTGVIRDGLELTAVLDQLVYEESWTETWAARNVATSLVLLIVGVAVFTQSRRMSALWHRLQGATPSPAA